MINSRWMISLCLLFIVSFDGGACEDFSLRQEMKRKEVDSAKVFIGKAIEQQAVKNALGDIAAYKIKFQLLKLKKGEVALDEYFWYPENKGSLAIVVGSTYYLYINNENEIDFGDFCSPGTYSLGVLTVEQFDQLLLKQRLIEAVESTDITELIWAKKYIEEKVRITVGNKNKSYWLEKLSSIESQLEKIR